MKVTIEENKKENKKTKKKEKVKKLPKEISQEILKKVFRNLLVAISIMLYFTILNVAFKTIKHERLIEDIKIFAGVFLIAGLIMFEKSYKEDKGKYFYTGIELLVISLHTLSIMHVINMFEYDFQLYLLTSSYVFSIYFVVKATIIYTKGRKEYLDSLSDITEIVKKDEPVKKEATKKNKIEDAEPKTTDKEQIKKENVITEEKTIKSGTKKTRKNTKVKKNEDKENKKNNEVKSKKTNKSAKEKKQEGKNNIDNKQKNEETKKKTTNKRSKKTIEEEIKEDKKKKNKKEVKVNE